jgi:hypothetical protein
VPVKGNGERERERERESEREREKGCLMNVYMHGFLKVKLFSVIVCLIGCVNGADYTSDFVCDLMCDLHANRRCDWSSAVASTVDMQSHLRFAANCNCDLQQIAHEIAHEIACVISL